MDKPHIGWEKPLNPHLVMHGPAHIFKITVIKKSVAVHFHPHTNLLDADRPDLCYRIAEENNRISLLMHCFFIPLDYICVIYLIGNRR